MTPAGHYIIMCVGRMAASDRTVVVSQDQQSEEFLLLVSACVRMEVTSTDWSSTGKVQTLNRR